MEPAKLDTHQVRRAYKRIAPWYDAWAALTESKAREVALQLASVQNGEAILEVAVGTGILFERVLEQNPDGENEGIDLTEQMLDRARKRVSRSGRTNFRLATGDARDLAFADNTFDLILNGYMFDLLPVEDFDTVLSEFRRVLKPGGRLVLTSMTRAERWYQGVWDRLYRLSPALLGGCRGVQVTPFLSTAGFVDVERQFVSQMTFPSEIVFGRKPA